MLRLFIFTILIPTVLCLTICPTTRRTTRKLTTSTSTTTTTTMTTTSAISCASCRPEQITVENSTTEFTIPFASDIISVDDTTGCKIRTFTCTGITLNVVIISVNFDDYTQGDITSTSVSFQCNADGVWQYTVDPNEPLLSTFIVNSVLCEDVGP
ncbi:unnamed protein product, partial [Mesorhabditis spiculigera]